MSEISYKPEKVHKILLKLSGEFLTGQGDFGFDMQTLEQLADDIIEVKKLGISIGIVIGGGNLFRGARGETEGVNRVTGDNIGMLATLQNSLMLGDYIKRRNYLIEVFSALRMDKVAKYYTPSTADSALSKGKICFFAGGTGNPYFTTDTAAVLRAIEINADLVLKGTKVDGIYDSDPLENKNAVFYSNLTYNEALQQRLKIMDLTAFSLAQENQISMKVFNLARAGNIKKAIFSKDEGTYIHS